MNVSTNGSRFTGEQKLNACVTELGQRGTLPARAWFLHVNVLSRGALRARRTIPRTLWVMLWGGCDAD